jgi:hypothetical protein
MKTKLLLFFVFSVIIFTAANAQVPQGFNYQALARDAQGNPVSDHSLAVRITLQTSQTGGTIVWEEQHTVTTNPFGLFSLVIGTGSRLGGTAASFSDIKWNNQSVYLKTTIQYPGTTWTDLGAAQIWAVPYSLIADKANGLADGAKVSVTSKDDQSTEALFEVKRQDGQTVFAVYPDAVNVYVPRSSLAKGAKGGFAIGGFDQVKQGSQDYFRVTPDSVRVYIDQNPSSKGSKGGFAIGGYGVQKGINDMYFNLSGSSMVNTVAESPQILWYPIKKAFLAGSVHIGSIDSVGENSTALGYKSVAMGNYSQAFGYKAKAFGNYSTSIGKNSIAGSKTAPLADNAFSLGNGAKALGNDSYAFGSGAIASGYRSFAFGSVGLDDSGNPTSTPTTANKDYTVAIGMGAQATQVGGMAFGIGAISSGYYSNSFGYYSTSSGYYSTALGFKSIASNNYAGAFGYFATAQGIGSIALGYGSIAIKNYSTAVGSSAKSDGEYASAFGRNATANGPSSVAIGYGAVTGSNATEASAFGRLANASGSSSLALGISSSSVGAYSTAIGYGASASGTYSTALGYNVQANGPKSISIGAYYDYLVRRLIYNPLTHRYSVFLDHVTRNNIASDEYSIAIGNGNTASQGGLALGSNNSALKFGSVAIGQTNIADSSYSFVAGSNSISRGYNAFALGESVTAESVNSFVIGYNNITNSNYSRAEWVPTDPLFVIGNGGSGSPSNALVVYKNGNMLVNGTITASGYVNNSSIKYKRDVNSITDYSWLWDLQPVDYRYKSDPDGKMQYGLIAEDVEKVNKDLVYYLNGEPDAINYNNIIAPLLKAVQDQKTTIESLQSDNQDLRLRLEKLEKLVNELTK